MKDYCKGVKCFMSFALSYQKNIRGDKIRCSCVKSKNKSIRYYDYTYPKEKKRSSLKNIYVGFHTKNHMFLIRPCWKGFLA
jgi:hypothetical protein